MMDPRVGLCSVCRHARHVGNRRGSRFWLCGLAADDPRFPRYPSLPVVRCPGFSPRDPGVEDPGDGNSGDED